MEKQNKPKIGQLFLRPSRAKQNAANVLFYLRKGIPVEIDCLETLDEILKSLKDSENDLEIVDIVSNNKVLSIEMAKRLRFERGLDIRPSAES